MPSVIRVTGRPFGFLVLDQFAGSSRTRSLPGGGFDEGNPKGLTPHGELEQVCVWGGDVYTKAYALDPHPQRASRCSGAWSSSPTADQQFQI